MDTTELVASLDALRESVWVDERAAREADAKSAGAQVAAELANNEAVAAWATYRKQRDALRELMNAYLKAE